jgi:hypothetical protein
MSEVPLKMELAGVPHSARGVTSGEAPCGGLGVAVMLVSMQQASSREER